VLDVVYSQGCVAPHSRNELRSSCTVSFFLCLPLLCLKRIFSRIPSVPGASFPSFLSSLPFDRFLREQVRARSRREGWVSFPPPPHFSPPIWSCQVWCAENGVEDLLFEALAPCLILFSLFSYFVVVRCLPSVLTSHLRLDTRAGIPRPFCLTTFLVFPSFFFFPWSSQHAFLQCWIESLSRSFPFTSSKGYLEARRAL